MRGKCFAVEDQVARIGDQSGHAQFLEAPLENFELAPGGNFMPVDNGDLRALGCASPIDVAHHQRVEQLGAEGIAVHFVLLGKGGHYRYFAEDLGKRFGVAGAGGRFAVVFGALERVGKKKGIQTRGGAREAIAGVQAREALFFGAEVELREEAAICEGGRGDALPPRGNGFGDDANALLVFRRKKEWAQERAMHAIAKGELLASVRQVWRRWKTGRRRWSSDFGPSTFRLGGGG